MPASFHDRLLSVAIADDDNVCRERTKSLLAAEGDIKVVAECGRTQEIPDVLREYKPDVLLLDPQIPGEDPFDVLASITRGLLPLVICTASQDQYALMAFESKAYDYIMKPFNQERLHGAIARARTDVARLQEEVVTSRQRSLIRREQPTPGQRLVAKCGRRILFLEFDEVDWIEAAANYVIIHVGNEAYRLREPIGEIERKVAPHNFSRIHRSIIVNVTRIKEVVPCNSGEYMVRLKNAKELSCSRGYNSAIRDLFDGRTEPPIERHAHES